METKQTEDLSKLTKDELIQRLTAAGQTIAEMQARQKQIAADDKLIAEKMNRGLNRNQAIAVIERQRKFDQTVSGAKASL
jgi:hypothetical protein